MEQYLERRDRFQFGRILLAFYFILSRDAGTTTLKNRHIQ